MLLTDVDGHLGNMTTLAWLVIALTLVQPVFLHRLLKRLCVVTE